MFYEPANRDRDLLPHDPFKAIVAPRPIGWISSLSEDGKPNLAPYSFFNAICAAPPMVMFCSDSEKDSVANIRRTGEFVTNYVGAAFTEAMNMTSIDAPHGVNEFELAGLHHEPSHLVAPPRVAGIAAALECRLAQIVELVDAQGSRTASIMVIGEVVGVYIDDAMIREGRFDVAAAGHLTRLGYRDYQGPEGYFEMIRPNWRG
ncbi:MAG: flavin reductase family protein [Nitratireductor sp.]|nr:flavin reductase family protein [Nitratireductor sp.]